MTKPELEILKNVSVFERPTLIKTDEGKRYSHFQEKDFELLMDFYDSLLHPNLKSKNWNFVLNLDSRFYTEWSMSNRSKSHYCYGGEEFLSFVRDETHFELIRKGYQWNGKEKNFDNLNEEQYDKIRERVLGGLTLRGIELFSDWNGDSMPRGRRVETEDKSRWDCVYDDQRNIRTDLNNYIIAFDSMKNFKI